MDFVELSTVLGNLGEFIGSVAVLATLIYLAVQVRQSKELLERNEKIGTPFGVPIFLSESDVSKKA